MGVSVVLSLFVGALEILLPLGQGGPCHSSDTGMGTLTPKRVSLDGILERNYSLWKVEGVPACGIR